MTDEIKRTIAVVDDDYRILESLESLLESAGHFVRLFPSGEAFLESGVLSKVDCLISDISMPGIDGFGLLRIAHLDRPDLPVILITGREELMNARSPAEPVPRYFFKKPFDGKKLLSAVSAALLELS
ncbi:response regulator [Granulicella sp. L60]|uniref:response regulator n=1 Tax=Granulicella sp. L60 TaxID=1641866 RepID=UPI00131B772C|nr:response regulator [Granulicella sp. L60]